MKCEFCKKEMPRNQKDSVCTVCDKELERQFRTSQIEAKAKRPARTCKVCSLPISGANFFFCAPCHTIVSNYQDDDYYSLVKR